MIPFYNSLYFPISNKELHSDNVYSISNLVIIPESNIDIDKLSDIFYKKNPYYDIVKVKDFFDSNINDIKKKRQIAFFAYNPKSKLFGFPPFSPWKQLLKDNTFEITNTLYKSSNLLDVNFIGKFFDYQVDAIKWWRDNHGQGIIQGLPGSGKTIVGLGIFSKVKRSTTILVHTKELLYQWKTRILEFTNTPEENIGIVGDSIKNVTGFINIALFQSLWKNPELLRQLSNSSLLIVDEAHRVGAPTFMDIISKFKSKFRLGLTATPYRTDGLDFMLYWFLGNGRKEMKSNQFYADIFLLRTGFRVGTIPKADYYTQIGILKKNLGKKRERLVMIADIIRRFKKDRNMIIALGTKKEVDSLYGILESLDIKGVSRLHSGIPKKMRASALESKIIVATIEIIKEGVDIPSKDMLVIGAPFQSRTLLEQLVGRIMRPKGKKPIIIDLIDESYPADILIDMTKKRIKRYKNFGHNVVGYFDKIEEIRNYVRG